MKIQLNACIFFLLCLLQIQCKRERVKSVRDTSFKSIGFNDTDMLLYGEGDFLSRSKFDYYGVFIKPFPFTGIVLVYSFKSMDSSRINLSSFGQLLFSPTAYSNFTFKEKVRIGYKIDKSISSISTDSAKTIINHLNTIITQINPNDLKTIFSDDAQPVFIQHYKNSDTAFSIENTDARVLKMIDNYVTDTILHLKPEFRM